MSDYLESVLGKKLLSYINRIHNTYLPQQIFDIIADTDRHEAYEKALKTVLRKRPNAHILQAERASILLAMEAVRL
ncbi:MAG: hypothetical protein GY941_16135, partial [Planctomycetes bacterium]|nr:hypothetical protein [Planctomycetota bacterium]